MGPYRGRGRANVAHVASCIAQAILAWADGASRAAKGSRLHALHAQCAGLLRWLQEAEEESGEDD